ncbi:hypothetical protein SNE40_015244 [Patella caerulea]|uniref:Uncharacterized protein n=1 Tax=Patella caerulea TaxID=87958 RepID=A0AAN8JKP8_PATCE
MASCSFYLCFINLSLLFGYLLSDPDTYCSQPRCVINPSTPCRVTSTSTIINFQTRCPSGLNPKLPDGGYRDLPGTPTDVKIERIDSTGQPILVISWKHPVPDKSLPPLQSFSVFVQAWDTKDSFKTKCLDRWFTVYSPSPTWPDHRTITLEITCPFFRDKWLFVYINSMFNTSSKCFVRQAHGIYKSSETPAGLPDYRVRLDPYGTEEISIKFNPTPAVEHVVLWCNSTQKAVCSSTDCQRAYLSAGYGMTVFRNVKSCQWYTLKICPQVSLSSRILYVAEVFIPELKAIETRNISQTIGMNYKHLIVQHLPFCSCLVLNGTWVEK